MPELRGLCRTNDKRPDGVTMILQETGQQSMDITVIDAVHPVAWKKDVNCHLIESSLV